MEPFLLMNTRLNDLGPAKLPQNPINGNTPLEYAL